MNPDEIYRSIIRKRDEDVQRRQEAADIIRAKYLDELKGLATSIKLAENRRLEIYETIER